MFAVDVDALNCLHFGLDFRVFSTSCSLLRLSFLVNLEFGPAGRRFLLHRRLHLRHFEDQKGKCRGPKQSYRTNESIGKNSHENAKQRCKQTDRQTDLVFKKKKLDLAVHSSKILLLCSRT